MPRLNGINRTIHGAGGATRASGFVKCTCGYSTRSLSENDKSMRGRVDCEQSVP